MKKMKKMVSTVLSLSMLITALVTSPYAKAAAETYFDDTVRIAKFGGSITSPGAADHWTQLTAQHIADTYGNGSYEMSNYAVGGIGSKRGLINMVQAFNDAAADVTESPDVVFIEYSVNDSDAAKVTYTAKDVTADNATVIAYDNEINDINIYNKETGTYEFDYYNSLNPTGEFKNGSVYPSGHYTVGVSEDTLNQAKLRIEEMVRLARALPSKPAVFLVNVGLGLTLGAEHATRPNFPGVANSIAKEYNKLAEDMGIGYIDVQDALWKYEEAEIVTRMAADSSKTRDEVRSALQLELYGDQSSIHPTSAASAVYADAIAEKIAAQTDKFLTYTESVTYTATASYSEDTHVIPYTAGEYEGSWGLTASSMKPFNYGMSTSAEGDTVKYNFTGPMAAIVAEGGTYSYSIYDNTAGEEVYTSSAYAKGIYLWDENTKIGGETLVDGHSYTITLTKGSDGTATTVYGIMADMTEAAGAQANGGKDTYTSYTEYNLSMYSAYSEQYYDFINKETAADGSIQTYFADLSELSYEGTIERADDRGALKLTATADNSAYVKIALGDDAAAKILNVEFDVKFDSSKITQSEFFVGDVKTSLDAKIFRVLYGNLNSPCINTGSNRFSTDVNNWWADNCNDGEYHKIRIRITPVDGTHSVSLYIDGVKGATEFLASSAQNYDSLSLNELKFGLTKANSEVYIDDIRIYDEVAEVKNMISALGEITLDEEETINAIRERADYINAQNGTYAQITNYQELVDAEAAIVQLKEMKANINFKPAFVYSPFVGSSIVYDFNSDYAVSKVQLNDADVEYDTNSGRLLLDKALFTEPKTNKLSVTFTNGSISYTEAVELTINSKDEIIIKTADLTADDYEISPEGISDKDVKTNWCYVSNKGWNGWAELGTEPYFLRMDTTAEITEGASYFTFKNLPIGTYTVEYAKYGNITEQRIPLIDVAADNFELKGVNPYSSAKTGYVNLGNISFVNNNTLKIAASATQRETNAADAIMCVYGIKLTPVPASESEILTYFETGKSIIDAINSAADVAELKEITELNGAILGVDTSALADMTGVYEKLMTEKAENSFADNASYKEAFEAAVRAAMVSKAVASVQVLEDLRVSHSAFYLRNATNLNLNSGDTVDRPAYIYYNLDLNNLKALEVTFEATNNNKRVVTMDASLTALPVTTAYNGLKEGEDFDKLKEFTESYTSEFTQSVTLSGGGDSVTDRFTIDISELIDDAVAENKSDLTLKFTINGNGGIKNTVLTAYYDETATKPLEVHEYYTVDKVSFVNVIGEENKGYIGSAYVTKNTDVAEDAKLLVASYAADGTFLGVEFVDLTGLATGESTKINVNAYTAYQPGQVKVFVWHNMADMVSYSESLTINTPTNRDDGDYGSAWYYPDGTFEEIPKN